MDVTFFYIIGAGFCVALVSLIGAVTMVGALRELLTRHLSLLTSFSAGVFLVVALGLVAEAIYEAANVYLALTIVAGSFIGVSLLFRAIPEAHHHHTTQKKHLPHSKRSARKLLFADALHNIGDGIVLGTAFSFGISFGIITTISIAIHEAIQEISEFFVLQEAGYSISRALFLNFVIALSVFIGIGISLFVSEIEFESIVVALAAGAFLHIVLEDMFPHSIRSITDKKSAFLHFSIALLGVILMLALLLFGQQQ